MRETTQQEQPQYPLDQELRLLREHVHESSVLAGRMSEAVSARTLNPVLASHVAALRHTILAAQKCAAVLALESQRLGLPG